MKGDWWQRLPLLLAVVFLLLAGGRQYLEDGENDAAAALVAAGLVVLGSWISVEVLAAERRRGEQKGVEPDDE